MSGHVWAERVRALTQQLVSIPSVNGTGGEVGFPDRLRQLLLESPAFRDHPERVRLLPIEDDPLGRRNLAAWVPAPGTDDPPARTPTVVLTGHFDVVTTSNLGVLEPFAFDPPRLAEAAARLLRAEADAGAPDPVAESDLASGDWLFGRGALDMKCGLAAGVAVPRAGGQGAGGRRAAAPRDARRGGHLGRDAGGGDGTAGAGPRVGAGAGGGAQPGYLGGPW